MSSDTAIASPTRAAPTSALLPALSGAAALAIVSLSQVLANGALSATALGSGAIPAGVIASLITGTLGAVVVALISRVPGEICGPRTSISVVYAALCADLVLRAGPQVNFAEVWAALAIAVILMGVIEIAAGWIRLGDAIKFMPYPVNAGFLIGIGLMVFWSQLGPLLGLEGRLSNYDWSALGAALKPGAILVAAVSAATIWLMPLVTKRGQPLLVGLVVGTLVHHAIAYFVGSAILGPTLGVVVPVAEAQSNFEALWTRSDVAWLFSTALYVLPYAAFLAVQGIMNAAVCSVSLAEITGVRANVNRSLVAQGIGNILCGGLAALPIGTSQSQSAAAARMRGVTGIVPVLSPLLLVLGVVFIARWLSYVPVAALAGLLVTVALGSLNNKWARGLARQVWRGKRRDAAVLWNLGIVVAVAASFFLGSVPVALLVGAVLATVLLAVDLSAVTTFDSHDAGSFASTRVWPAEQAQWLTAHRNAIRIFRPRGGLFFGTADQLASRLATLPTDTKYCVLDLSRLTTLDATGCQIIAAGAKKLAASGVTTVIAGLSALNPRDSALIAVGLTHPNPRTHWFADLDHALEWVEGELIAQQWPNASDKAPVPLAETPLGRGLSGDELRELEQDLTRVEREAGPLFKRGDPGSATYVIDEGAVEIRIDAASGQATRLAAFGPGSIFGEIAMLTSDERTADAVCLKPTRLYELTRDALNRLEAQSPRLYARLMTNLNTHLANRLIVATSTVQAQR